MKRWSEKEDKPTCIFSTTHNDMVGGGELYANQVADCFNKLANMRYFGNRPHRNMNKYHWIDPKYNHTSIQSECDIFVWCSHFTMGRPIGRHRNILVVHFPNNSLDPSGYDTVITNSNFSAKWVRKYWRKKATVIYPWCDPKIYKPSKERKPKKRILNVGRFFREPHGHSKHQDILIEAFNELLVLDGDWHLSLAGSCLSENDWIFARHCEEIAKAKGIDKRVSFHYNIEKEDLLRLYQTSPFYWHANGYKSKDPYETEHFGIVFVEAMMCGALVYPYSHGGVDEFGSPGWKERKDLVEKTLADWESLKENFNATRKSQREFASRLFTEEEMESKIRGEIYR